MCSVIVFQVNCHIFLSIMKSNTKHIKDYDNTDSEFYFRKKTVFGKPPFDSLKNKYLRQLPTRENFF